MRNFYVYIAASISRRLYIGVTTALARRMLEHRHGMTEGFTKRYRINRLVHFETFGDAASAIHREKRLKTWPRARKIALIERHNAGWLDLATTMSSLATERSDSSLVSSLATERSEGAMGPSSTALGPATSDGK